MHVIQLPVDGLYGIVFQDPEEAMIMIKKLEALPATEAAAAEKSESDLSGDRRN